MKVIVAGGGYAGLAAALRVKRRDPDNIDVTVVNDGPRLVERIRLHQESTGQAVRQRPLRPLLARADVRFVEGRVEGIRPASRHLIVSGVAMPYDRLVLALGSAPRTDDVPGAAEHAFTLTGAHARGLAQRLRRLAGHGGRVAVVGTGLCGVEAATEIAEAFPALHVTLVGRAPPLDGWSETARTHVQEVCARLGILVRAGVEVNGIGPGWLEAGGAAVAFDACIWATGFEVPWIGWDAGLAINRDGRIRVDAELRSVSHPEIYAVGDIAAPQHAEIPAGCKSAMPMGAHAGDNLAREQRGGVPLPFDYAVLFYCVSLGRRAGVIQWPGADGSLRGPAWTGWRAAWMKELICRSTCWALDWESRGLPAVAWRQGEGGPVASGSVPLARGAGD